MFRRCRPAAPAAAPHVNDGLTSSPALVADLDRAAISRDRALRYQLGRQLQGGSGLVVGYDRGDPANTITAVVIPPQHSPSDAIAALGFRQSARLEEIADPNSQDVPGLISAQEFTAYQQALLNRITR